MNGGPSSKLQGKHTVGCGCVTEGSSGMPELAIPCVHSSGERPHCICTTNERTWSVPCEGQCSLHPAHICSCGKCEDDNLHCAGKPYESKFVLSCELHALGYEIEYENTASNLDNVIHPTMGHGHSNLCEAAFSVLLLWDTHTHTHTHTQLELET